MKKIVYLFAFIPFVIACNSGMTNFEPISNSKSENYSKSDSSQIVESNDSWSKLLAIDKSLLNDSSTRLNDKFVTQEQEKKMENGTIKEATFGAGCFWCIEACFLDIKGIISVVPGYAGGKRANPTYEQVCSGATGHAEVARITYDEAIISFDELLEMFWFVHDPTQLNRQGNDIGTQYRSVIFYHSESQKEIAERYKAKLTEEQVWDNPIVTEIVAINNYYEAEKYHHNYLELNPENAYCKAIVRPKVDKFKKVFGAKMN